MLVGVRFIQDIWFRLAASRLALVVVLLWALLLSGCSRHNRMLVSLKELERRNAADSLMTDRAEAERLADYFDAHGDANERMRAHYILGRTLADLGDAPAALASYQDAIDCEDTTAANCDWYRLSRVYSQMSDVFYYQNLMDDNLDCINRSIYYAWRAKDTLQALRNAALCYATYDVRNQFDVVASQFPSVYQQLQTLYGDSVAAGYALVPVRSFLQLEQNDEAKYYLDQVRNFSGFINPDGYVEGGREVIYYYLGSYYQAMHQYDSAEWCFRQELHQGQDMANQSMASRGLSLLFDEMHQADSASKYAIYSYAANDSVYTRMATLDVERVTSMYDYSRHQRVALQAQQLAEQRKWQNVLLLTFLIVVIVSFIATIRYRRKKRKLMVMEHERRLHELEQAQQLLAKYSNELEELKIHEDSMHHLMKEAEETIGNQHVEIEHLKAHETLLRQLIEDKQGLIAEQKEEVNRLRLLLGEGNGSLDGIESRLATSESYRIIQQRALMGRGLTATEWKQVEGEMESLAPVLHQFLLSGGYRPGSKEYRLCILFRFHVKMKEAGNILNVSKTSISKLSTAILQNLFKASGSGKELKQRLEKMR